MAWYPARGGGIPASVKTDMNAVLNKKIGTVGETYPPKEWADDVNLMGLLPIRTASGAVASFSDGADDVPLKSLTANIVPIQEGTGTPSPSNPRPISGTSVLNVEQRGVNLFDEDLEEGWLNTSTGEPQEYSNRMRSKNFSSIVPGQTYYIKCGNNEEAYWYFYDSNKTYLRRRLIRNTTTTTQVDECFFKVGIVGISSYSDDISLNYPSTDTDYHAYTGSTYTVNLGRTVYGGSADVVGGSGSITHVKKRLLHTDNWGTAQNAFYLDNFFTDMPNTFTTNKTTPKCMSEIGKENDYVIQSSEVPNRDDHSYFNQLSPYQNRLWVKESTFSTLSDFLTYLENNEVYICIPLATPTDFTFEGEEINSYLGVNNLYVDSGEVLDVEYRADMNLLIASLEGNRGLQMMRATPTEENDEQEVEENEDER